MEKSKDTHHILIFFVVSIMNGKIFRKNESRIYA